MSKNTKVSGKANTVEFFKAGKSKDAVDLPNPISAYATKYQQTDKLNAGLYNVPSESNPNSVNTYRVTAGLERFEELRGIRAAKRAQSAPKATPVKKQRAVTSDSKVELATKIAAAIVKFL